MLLKKSLTKIIKILGIVFAISYPFIVFLALKKHIALRAVVVLLLIMAGFNFVQNKNRWVFGGILLLCMGMIIFNQNIFLKLYPVLMNFGMCVMFALSVHKTPLITKFALGMGYELNSEQKKHTLKATYAWAIFMGILTILSLVTVFLSNEVWVIFNGLISYILIGIMIVIEFLIHKRYTCAVRNK